MMTTIVQRLCFLLLFSTFAAHHRQTCCSALNIVLAGGTGQFGRTLAPKLSDHQVTILCRNAFLAAANARASSAFGWLGGSFLRKNPHVRLRYWDGGDLLDITGCDWMGWQEDALAPAHVVVHLVGGFTDQRVKAARRLVRESQMFNPRALQITVNPLEDQLRFLSPGVVDIKAERIRQCEEMVQNSFPANSVCLRLPVFKVEESCNEIVKAIEARAAA